MELAQRLSQVGEYYFSQKLAQLERMRGDGRDIINLGIGSPDLPPADDVRRALCAGVWQDNIHGYSSYKGNPAFLQAVATWYKRYYGVELDATSEVISLYGSKEGLIYLCQAYINDGDKVLVPNPGYPAYAAAVKLSGGVCVNYDLTSERGYVPDFDTIDGRGVKMMFLNYPHMPTGAQVGVEVFERYVEFAKANNILLVHDNPYSFIRNATPLSILSVEGAFDVAVELNSLSKSHNMAGWRIGMMVGRADVLSDVMRYKSNLNNAMFEGLQRAATVALALGDDWYFGLNEVYARREAIAYQIMEAIGVKCRANQAGLFLWGQMPSGAGSCYEFIDHILETTGVFITPGAIFGSSGEGCVRISLCANEDLLNRALKKLESV